MIEIKDLAKEIDAVLIEFMKAERETRQKAVRAGAELMKAKLEQASPRGKTGEFAKSWDYKEYGSDKAYVYNKKEVKKKQGSKKWSLANILEFRPNGKPFIRKTADASADEVRKKIIEVIRGGN
jgi:hypothetical protein